MNPLFEAAVEAVRAIRDGDTEDGRGCQRAFLACSAAGVAIADIRVALWQAEREAFLAALRKRGVA